MGVQGSAALMLRMRNAGWGVSLEPDLCFVRETGRQIEQAAGTLFADAFGEMTGIY